MTFQDFIINIIASTTVVGIVAWLAREWISSRLKASIQHEYDQKLEAHKAHLKSENDVALLETKNSMDQQLALFEATRTSFAEGQKAAMERRLDSIEKLWNEILRLKNEQPGILDFINLLSVDEYREACNRKDFRELAKDWPMEKVVKYVAISDNTVEKVRPYIGEYLWSMFFAYRQIMGRIPWLLYESLKDANKAEWHKDNGIRQILEVVLSKNELAEFETIAICKISWLQEHLESKVLTALQKLISGEEFSAESLKQAKLIQQRVATVEINRDESLRKR